MTLESYKRYARKVLSMGLNPTDPATGFHLRLPMDVKITKPVTPDTFILGVDPDRRGRAKRIEAIKILDIDCGGIEFSVVVHLHKDELRLTTSDNVTGMSMPVSTHSEKGNPVNNLIVGALHYIHSKGRTLEQFKSVQAKAYAQHKEDIERKP